jgi:hypothetical protein
MVTCRLDEPASDISSREGRVGDAAAIEAPTFAVDGLSTTPRRNVAASEMAPPTATPLPIAPPSTAPPPAALAITNFLPTIAVDPRTGAKKWKKECLSRRVASALALSVLLAESSAVADEPTKLECVAANEGAQKLRRAHRLLEARSLFLSCVTPACPGPVREDCLDELDAVEKALPTIVFVVRGPDRKDLTAVSVTMDDLLLADHLDGSAIQVDPGEHAFSFESEGFAWTALTIRIRDHDKRLPVHVTLRPLPAIESVPAKQEETPAPANPPATPVPPRSPAPTPRIPPDSGTWKKLSSYVALGVGGAGIAVGSVFGVAALNKKSSLDSACPDKACPPSRRSDIGALHTDAVASNVSLGIGIVGLGVGGVFLFLWRQGPGAEGSSAPGSALIVSPWVGLDGAGLQGTFR